MAVARCHVLLVLICITLSLIPATSAAGTDQLSSDHIILPDTTPPSLQLTPAELAWIAKNPVFTVAIGSIEPYAIAQQDGHVVGYKPDLMRMITQQVGLEAEFVITDLAQGLAKAQAGEVDVIMAAIWSEEREASFYFSKPHVLVNLAIFARMDDTSITDLESLQGKRIASFQGYGLQPLMEAQLQDVEFIMTANAVQMFQAVARGQADAAIRELYSGSYIMRRNFLNNLEVKRYAEFAGTENIKAHFFMTHKRTPLLHSILEKGIANLSEGKKQAVWERWFGRDLLAHRGFTHDELAWLERHRTVFFSFDPKWAPVEFVDEKGRAQGISIDYLHRLNKSLGISFQPSVASSWTVAQNKLEQAEIMLLPAVTKTAEREQRFLFTDPYLSIPIKIFSATQAIYLNDLYALYGQKVAVVKDYAIYEWLQRDHPQLQLLPAQDIPHALQLVTSGEAFAFIGNVVAASYYIGRKGVGNIRIVGETPYQYELAMAVPKSQPVLHNILQNALQEISQAERDAIYNRWISIQYIQNTDYTLLWRIAAIVAVILAMFGYWNHRLSREIVQRRHAEAALSAAKEKALAANHAKSQWLVNISHEIRTPMNGVIGMTELLLDTRLNTQQTRYVKAIKQSGESLLHIINDVLDISKVESGRLTLCIRDFNLGQLLQEFETTMAALCQAKSLRFACTIDHDVPIDLRGDPDRLLQILNNFTGNAVKFTQQGYVNVHIKCVHSTKKCHKDARQIGLQFSICDTGIGIDKSHIQLLFEDFYQVDSSSSRMFGGTGLGLSISKRLIDVMHGTLQVESQLGQGSCFIFTLCFAQSSCKLPSPTEEKQPQHLDDALQAIFHSTILVVEDNLINQQIVVEHLHRAQLNVDVASNGLQAVEAACCKRYALILMDIQMPGMDGLEATRLIRQQGLNIHTPIIALTAHALASERDKGFAAGMSDYLSKPVYEKELLQTLLTWIPPQPQTTITTLDRVITTDNRNAIDTYAWHVTPGIDVAKGLQIASNQPALYARLLHNFMQKHANTATEIATLYQQERLHDARLLAHALKGVAVNLAMPELADSASKLESQLLADNASTTHYLDELRHCLHDVTTSIPTVLLALPVENRQISSIADVALDKDKTITLIREAAAAMESDLDLATQQLRTLQELPFPRALQPQLQHATHLFYEFETDAARFEFDKLITALQHPSPKLTGGL